MPGSGGGVSGLLARALGGSKGKVVASSPQQQQVVHEPSLALDDGAWPCLLACNLEDGGSSGDDGATPDDADDAALLAEGVRGMRLSSAIDGGAPRSYASSFADYAVHRQHRGDGKEVPPSPGGGAGSFVGSSFRANFITADVLDRLPSADAFSKQQQLQQGGAADSFSSESPAVQRRFSSLVAPPSSGGGAQRSAGSRGALRRFARGALKGSVVAFITAGYSGKRFCFARAKELGVRCVVVDGPDSWARTLVDDGLAERFVAVDFTDGDTVTERVLAALVEVREELGGLDAVTTFNELAVSLTARLAERLNLPGNTPLACDTARDKHAARKAMEAAGLPSPKCALIDGPGDVDAAAAAVGFPAVIKPLSAAASMGVVRVDDLAALRAQVAATQRLLRSTFLTEQGELVEAAAGGDGEEAGGEGEAGAPAGCRRAFASTTILMEEFLDGGEVDVDVVLSDGAATYGCVSDNWDTIPPYFNETGSNCPSVLPGATQRELAELAVASLRAMGFTLGVFHVELKATSRGPRLIEVNARMGGGPVRDLNLAVWGVDLVEEHLLASCGLPARPVVARKPLARIAEYTLNADATGVVTSDDFMAPFAAEPDVLYARALVRSGDRVVCAADAMPTWLAEVAVKAPSVRAGIQRVKDIERRVFAASPIAPAAATEKAAEQA